MENGRSPCCDKNLVKRRHWTPAEDLKLKTFINKNGYENWRALPQKAGLMRCGNSCRLRWLNYLRPDLTKTRISQKEEETIMKLHEALGNKWSTIASHLPGRTDNEIKNYWNTHLKKKLACKKTSEPVSAFQGAKIKEPEQGLVEHGSIELADLTKNPNQSSSSAAAVSPLHSNNFIARKMDAYKPKQQMFSPLFKEFEHDNVDKPSKEAYQQNSSAVETPFEADCDFWKILDNMPINSNEIQLGHDHDIHNQTFIQENKDQFFQKNYAIELEIDPYSFGYDEMTWVESDSDIDLGYGNWYSSWPQNPSI